MSKKAGLARKSHYVPQAYFRRWSFDRCKVWGYRTLVPRNEIPPWNYLSIESIAVRRDLYTSVADGGESDRIELWLQQSVENPALPVLDRVCRGDRLSKSDRSRLARYIAALSARSPLNYAQHTQLMSTYLEGVLNETVERTFREIAEAQARGETLVVPEESGRRFSSITTKLHRNPGEQPALHLRAVIGREVWLSSIEHVVNDLSPALEDHDSQVFQPHHLWTWCTSDHPVLLLNGYPNGTYDFKGGFNRAGGEIVLPLSPTHLLYTHVERPRKQLIVLSAEQTTMFKRLIAENAYRYVIANGPDREIEWFRRRVVNLQTYRREEIEWETFHEQQSAAERELREDQSNGG